MCTKWRHSPSARGLGFSRPPSCISSKENATLCTYMGKETSISHASPVSSSL
jgi:hypothetical protein